MRARMSLISWDILLSLASDEIVKILQIKSA